MCVYHTKERSINLIVHSSMSSHKFAFHLLWLHWLFVYALHIISRRGLFITK